MSCFFLPFLLALLTVQQCTSLPVLSSNRNPSATLERFSDFLLTPRQVHNSQSRYVFTFLVPHTSTTTQRPSPTLAKIFGPFPQLRAIHLPPPHQPFPRPPLHRHTRRPPRPKRHAARPHLHPPHAHETDDHDRRPQRPHPLTAQPFEPVRPRGARAVWFGSQRGTQRREERSEGEGVDVGGRGAGGWGDVCDDEGAGVSGPVGGGCGEGG